MSEPKWVLQLTFKNDYGQSHHMAIDVGHDVAREIYHIEPPPPAEISHLTFSDVATILKRKQFRKDLFMRECTRLGAKLAEFLEDKEGWHGASRQDNAERTLSKGGE